MFENLNYKLREKKQNFKDTAQMVVNCQNGVVHSIFQQVPYVLVFKTTNWCWNKCVHCCESAGPDMPKKFIPESVIIGYIDQAVMDKNFGKEIVFTGGEITAAYKFASRDYIPNIINHALNAGCGVDIKTNCGWVNSPLATTIYSDIENIARTQGERYLNSIDTETKDTNSSLLSDLDEIIRADRKQGKNNGIKNVIPLQISLSLDRFHKDSMMRDFKFLEHFAHTDIPGTTFTVNVSSVKQDKNMFCELLDKLIDSGICVREFFTMDSDGNFHKRRYDLNDNVLIFPSNGTLFNGGRAKNIEYAFKTPFPQFTFITPAHESLVAFDSFGNVTLGENCGKKISTPWVEPQTGDALSLETVRKNLLTATKQAEQDYLMEHKVMNAYFNWVRRQFVKDKS